MQQLEDNMGAAGWALNAEQMEKLNSASQPQIVYPYEHVEGAKKRR